MNEFYNEQTKKLSGELGRFTLEYLMHNLSEEEEADHILNLILSSHASAIFNLMLMFSEDYPNMHKKVKKFIEDFKKFLTSHERIVSVETL